MPDGLVTDDDQQVDAWIDDEGSIRRLVTRTTNRVSMGPAGTVPAEQSTMTSATTVEAFDYDQVALQPASGDDVTPLGSLPAEVLRPLDHPDDPCGQSPTGTMLECTSRAFDEATSGRTVEQFVPTIPKTLEALLTPNGWFERCPMGIEPEPAPTQEQLDRVLELAGIDEARVQVLLDAAAAVPSLAGTPPPVLVTLAMPACNAVRYGRPEIAIQAYDPRLMIGGITKDAYRDLVDLIADPALGFCP
jgi:hypothetical protein